MLLDLAALERYEKDAIEIENALNKSALYIEEVEKEVREIRSQRDQSLEELRLRVLWPPAAQADHPLQGVPKGARTAHTLRGQSVFQCVRDA